MAILADVLGTRVERRHEPAKLLDGFLIGPLSFLGSRQFRFAEHSGVAVAAGPGDACRWAGAEEIHPVERAAVVVEADIAALDEVLADVVAVEIEVHGRLEFA